MTKVLIAPSILSYDFAKMGEACERVAEWGADVVHCDVMDGVFVPNLTFGMPMVKALKKYSVKPLDVHLMITEPEKYVGQFCDAGADFVTFHPNASKDVRGALNEIKAKGKLCGLALNPDISLEVIKPYLDIIDILLIMSVYAGFGGQKFIESSVEKLSEARKMLDATGRKILLEVDGGVTEENAAILISAGVDIMVAGNTVFNSKNPAETVKNLKN